MRQIILDTETTGFDPESGHRLVEVGCLELKNNIPTGKTFQQYINPERDVPMDAFNVHGLSLEFLKDFPPFRNVAPALLDFLEDSPLIIHNAKFDIRFLNAELRWLNLPEISWERAICTLEMARRKFPGAQASLDALCRRFNINNTNRVKHGALLDSELLAEVYIELTGGRQAGFKLTEGTTKDSGNIVDKGNPTQTFRPPRPHSPKPEELALHQELLSSLKNPLWLS